MTVQQKTSKGTHQQHWMPRDLSFLTLLMQQRAIRLDHVSDFVAQIEATANNTYKANTKSTAHNLVERLQREGLLHLQRFGKSQPAWIWLTQKGLHALGNASSWKRPSRRTLPLLYAANTVRLQLTAHHPQGTWISQQQLKSAEAEQSFSHLPTAELLTDTGERMAIHVVFRLTGTDKQIATRMCQQLERKTSSGTARYTALWYYAPNDAATRLRSARISVAEIATKELARNISIFSYPLQRQLLYRGHHAPVQALAWSADGKRLSSVGEDLHVWNATTGEIQFHIPIPASPSVVAWSCDDSWIGLGDKEGGLSFWTGSTGEESLIDSEASQKITGMAWSPQQKDLVAWCSAAGQLQLHDVRQNAFQWGVQCIHGAQALAWSPDGSRLAIGGNDGIMCFFSRTGKRLRTFKKHHSAIQALSWSPDSQLLASAANDSTISIWDATTGKKLRTIRSSLSAIGILAWAPDGTSVACAGSDPCVQVWHVQTGRLLQTYKDHADAITSIAWSPDSTLLASASDDGTVHVYPAVGGSS